MPKMKVSVSKDANTLMQRVKADLAKRWGRPASDSDAILELGRAAGKW